MQAMGLPGNNRIKQLNAPIGFQGKHLQPLELFQTQALLPKEASPQTRETPFKGLPYANTLLFGTNSTSTPLSQHFPSAETLPSEFKLDAVPQGEYTLLNGELKKWNGPFQPVESSILQRTGTGETSALKTPVIGKLPLMGKAEALLALQAATKAYDKGLGEWPMMSTSQRIGCLETFIEAMKPQRETVAKIEMHEIGKSYEDCLKEFDRTIEYMGKSIEALKQMDASADVITELGGKIKKELRTPKGVALCMGPYNYPLNEEFAGMIPALLMGNTIICKLPKIGGLCNTPLLEAFQKSFPKGVINFLSGDGATLISPIMESGQIDIFSFIGSENVANAIEKQHPFPNRLTSVLGLGAKNPGVILPDADLDKTVKEVVAGALSFNGQRCTALKILFVPKGIAQSFQEKLTAAVKDLKVGMPYEKGVKITPLPDTGKVDYMKGLVADALAKGAVVLNPETAPENAVAGTFFKPVVLSNVTPEMRIYREEQFGPIIPIVTYEDPKTVLRYIQDSPVGQQASIFGKNPAQLNQVVKSLKNQFCRVNINEQCQRSPDEFAFDGRKNSAKGTLSITDALRGFSTLNMITLSATDGNKALLEALSFEKP
ncbi:MAG: aldehyde dehydrogenase family protein [Cyanobacteria bacterium]|nr:aldehyde dehydrogenase family protein [Cyanobacteriota bacterium]